MGRGNQNAEAARRTANGEEVTFEIRRSGQP
jgi:hypothetical protein